MASCPSLMGEGVCVSLFYVQMCVHVCMHSKHLTVLWTICESEIKSEVNMTCKWFQPECGFLTLEVYYWFKNWNHPKFLNINCESVFRLIDSLFFLHNSICLLKDFSNSSFLNNDGHICHFLSRPLRSLVVNFQNEGNFISEKGAIMSSADRCCRLFAKNRGKKPWKSRMREEFCRAQSGRARVSSRNVNGRVSHSEFECPTSARAWCVCFVAAYNAELTAHLAS